MERNIFALIFFTVFFIASQAQTTSICFKYNGGFFYTTPVNATCNIFCETHGGFDANVSRHEGNAVGMHFWPNKTSESKWETVECSSIDNNSNWGATGADPDPEFSHEACHLNCACFTPTVDCEGNSCDNLAETDSCKDNVGTIVVTGSCKGGVCDFEGVACDDGDDCTTGDAWKSRVCVGTTAANGTACGTDSQCNMCMGGSCLPSVGLSCNDGNTTTCNDVCSAAGICRGAICPPVAPLSNNAVAVGRSALVFVLGIFTLL